MAQHWPTEGPLKLGVSASYLLDPKRYKIPASLQIGKPGPVKLGRITLTPDAVVWKMTKGKTTGFVTLALPKIKEDPVVVAWSGSLTCSFSERFLQEIDELVWKTLQPIVSPKKHE